MKKAVRILAVVALVVLCASCTKTSSKCKCTSVIMKNGEEYMRTETDVDNPGRCSDLNSNMKGGATVNGTSVDETVTCVEI